MIEELHELAARKRKELESALDAREVHDPISSSFLISLAISAAVSAASALLSIALAPKPPKQTIGKLQGSLQLMNSEQGIFIPEIYGAGPTGSTVAGSNPTYQNLTNTTGGANGSITKTSGTNNVYNAGASHNVAVNSGDDAFLRIVLGSYIAAAGFFNTASPTGSGVVPTGLVFGIQWSNTNELRVEINAFGTVVGTYNAGDTVQIELRSGRFRLYKNSAEIVPSVALPSPTYPLYMGVIMHTTGAGVSNAKVKINGLGDPPNYARGGVKVPAIIDWSSGIRKHVSVTQQPAGGKGFGHHTQTVENVTYDLDLGMTFARGPLNLLREYANADVMIDQMSTSLLVSGVYNPATGADADYDPTLPPDPKISYMLPIDRQDASIAIDGNGVGTGTVQGGGSSFAVYPGNATQDPDPTEEADIDAKYGTGSTTAHRGKSRIVHTNFNLSRWGGIVPNMTAAWEHQTLKTLDAIFASLCERVNVKTANGDYDFSGLTAIKSRGMLLAGRLFSPAEVIGSPEIQTVYNYFVTEAEGQIIGYIEGAQPSVTIADTEIGWMETDADLPDVLPEVDSVLAPEINLARQVDVKYIDLDKEWEPNTQSDNRQITDGVTTELLEVQLALLADEARAVAQRKLYRDYVAGSVHKFTLPWTYLYLYPGYKITITRAEGFTHVMKLTSISGGLGVLECEGVAIEPAAYTQTGIGSFGTVIPPVQLVPAMTILTAMDIPSFDPAIPRRFGLHFAGTPRTTDLSWVGFALLIKRGTEWVELESFRDAAVMGVVVSASDLYADPTITDIVYTVNATTNIFTVLNHKFTSGMAVVVDNLGGAAPAPLVVGTTYYIRDVTTDTFKLAATVGGTAIDITTTGTGSNFLNAGTIVVDLYGTSASLHSMSKPNMYAGLSKAVAGDMIFGFANAVQVAGFPNRWAISILRTGQNNTYDKLGSVVAGRNFCMLYPASVKFVELDPVLDANTTLHLKAVSFGASLADASETTVVCTGQSWRADPVTDISVGVDASSDWFIQFIGHPKPEEDPADYAVEVWDSGFVNRRRTLPLTTGTNHACHLYVSGKSTGGAGYLPWPPTGASRINYYTTGADAQNNVGGIVTAMTVEPLIKTYSRYDFSFQNVLSTELYDVIDPFSAGDGGTCTVALETRTSITSPYTPTLANAPISIEWSAGTALGTVKEIYKTYGTTVLTRDNVDVGKTGAGGAIVRSGPRYTFLLSGTEYRVYVNYNANQGQKPILIVPSYGVFPLPVSFPFPLRLTYDGNANFRLSNITSGGALYPNTMYASREQVLDFGSNQTALHLKIYQKGRTPQPDGFMITADVP